MHLNNCSRKKMQMNFKLLTFLKLFSNMCQLTHIIIDLISVYILSCDLILSLNIVHTTGPLSDYTCFPIVLPTSHFVLRHSNRYMLLPYCYFNYNFWLVKMVFFHVIIYCAFFFSCKLSLSIFHFAIWTAWGTRSRGPLHSSSNNNISKFVWLLH